MAGDSSDYTRPSPALSKIEDKENQCMSPITPLSFSKFSIDTEWGEMEDYDDIAGGPVCASPAMSSPGSYGFSSPTGLSHTWFDVRVIYVRIAGCSPEEDPDSLTIRFPPRNIGVTLEVSGGWISPTEESYVVLRRDRVDTETAEATYVSTDNLRISGTISYEVINKDEALVIGTLEHVDNCQEIIHGSKDCFPKKGDQAWGMECRCVIGNSGCFFNKSRHDFSASLLPPTMEVSMVGRHMNVPVFLTQTVRLIARRKSNRVLTLDVIPETEELGKSHNGMILVDEPQLMSERSSYMDLDDENSFMDVRNKVASSLGYGLEGVYGVEGEDGQMTWFNAGVRVGVGIGLGMCLGAGIGIGLMVRTYQATTRTLRRVI